MKRFLELSNLFLRPPPCLAPAVTGDRGKEGNQLTSFPVSFSRVKYFGDHLWRHFTSFVASHIIISRMTLLLLHGLSASSVKILRNSTLSPTLCILFLKRSIRGPMAPWPSDWALPHQRKFPQSCRCHFHNNYWKDPFCISQRRNSTDIFFISILLFLRIIWWISVLLP